MRLTRRQWLLAAGGLAGCAPKLAKRFNGYAFVANAGSRTVAAVNLTHFRVDKELACESAPSQVVNVPGAKRVLAFSPGNAGLAEIDAETLETTRRVRAAGAARSMRLGPGARTAWVLASDPPSLVPVALGTFRADAGVPLPGQGADFDLDVSGTRAIVSVPSLKRAVIVDLAGNRVLQTVETNGEPGVVRFRPDGRQVLIGLPAARAIVVADAASGRALVTLPLAFSPERFCFGAGGGQLFVSGRGMDAIAIVYPYQTLVSETILAGRAPGAMAVGETQIFVANPESGDVTVIEIQDRRVMAKIQVGEEPVALALADEYLLVVNRKSCDVSVVRLSKLTDFRYKRAGLFTVIPVGEGPVSAAVCRL